MDVEKVARDFQKFAIDRWKNLPKRRRGAIQLMLGGTIGLLASQIHRNFFGPILILIDIALPVLAVVLFLIPTPPQSQTETLPPGSG